MSNRIQEELEFDELYETEISEEDYGFIVGPDGKLKSVMLPESIPFKQPKTIQRIFKIFGISDADALDNTTLH